MEKLPVLRKISEVGIPTKKLNTIEQKNYRNYADTVCDTVRKMLVDIKNKVLDKYEVDNRLKIIESIAQKLKTAVLSKTANDLVDRINAVNKKSKNIVQSIERKIEKLEIEKESALGKIKEEELMPLIEEFNKHRDVVGNRDDIRNPYTAGMRVKTVKEYEYDDDDDDDGKMFGRPRREITLEFPAINVQEVIGGFINEKSFVKNDDIALELGKIMQPAKNEFEVAELKLANMEQSVKEVMLFDEAQMNEAFTKLLEFRDSIQKQYISIVKGIDPELLNNGNGEEE